jgi:peptide deformylase
MKSDHTRKNIITLPNKTLRQRSAKVHVVTEETVGLVNDMLATALDWEASRPHEMAVALAAVQINQLERVIIVREDFDDKDNHNFIVLINPEIIKKDGRLVADQEGCLSVKDIYGLVPRHEKVRVKATDLKGKEIRIKSTNPFLSRILQHEIDHCNGICFVDHITHQESAFSILNDAGDLEPIEYKKVVAMGILKED